MGRNLVPAGASNNALAPYGGVNPWAEAARDVETGAYLKFNGNTGDMTFGSDDTPLPMGSLLVVDMVSFALGWICWSDSEAVEEILVPVTEGKPPLEHELTDHGPYNDDDDGWREAASVSAVILEVGDGADAAKDPDVGTRLLFKTSTGGQVRSLKKLSGQYGKLFMQHAGKLPIVEVQSEEYTPKVKKHGKKYALILKIVDWIAEDDLANIVGGGDEEDDYEPEDRPVRGGRAAAEEEEPESKPTRTRRATPAAEESEEEPAPRSRRSAPPAEEEQEEAPAPRSRRSAPPAEEEEASDEDVAPAPRGRSAGRRSAPAAGNDGDDAPPARAGRRQATAAEEEDTFDPAPRGRSPSRNGNARVRRF